MAMKANNLQSMLGVWEDMTLQRLTLNQQKGFVYSRAWEHKCS